MQTTFLLIVSFSGPERKEIPANGTPARDTLQYSLLFRLSTTGGRPGSRCNDLERPIGAIRQPISKTSAHAFLHRRHHAATEDHDLITEGSRNPAIEGQSSTDSQITRGRSQLV